MTAGTGAWSVPEVDVMESVGDAIDGRQAVLATVVAVEGSAYRRPGAKMLIPGRGDSIGSLTPGCLEAGLLRLAERVLADGAPRTERFDLTTDGDGWGLGIGCNGVIDVLFEPVDARHRPVVDAFGRGDDVASLTVLDATNCGLGPGEHALAFPTDRTGECALSFEAPGWPEWVLDSLTDPIKDLLAADRSDTVTLDRNGDIDVFVDSITAPPELVIVGSGHDVAPLAEQAAQVGFRSTVVCFRGGNATTARFPAADRVLSTSPAEIGEAITFDTATYPVVMTHNFVDDRIAIEELLGTPVEYIGLLGPRERFEEMQAALAEDGRSLSDAERDRIHTPAGLDLGGGTPFHIAQSIVAEVTAVHHERDPKHLSDRRGPIHDRPGVSVVPGEDG